MVDSSFLRRLLSYLKKGDHATTVPSSLRFWNKPTLGFKDKLNYVYDNLGNVTKIYENGKLLAKYAYDGVNRLIREDNVKFGESYFFAYDKTGNITSKRTCPLTFEKTEKVHAFSSEDIFSYNGDKLVAKNGVLCSYSKGKPTTYLGKAMEFKEKGLISSYNGISFTYDDYGKRKTKGNLAYTYTHDGDLETITDGTSTITFLNNHTNQPLGFKIGDVKYFYRRNLQGDIIAILDTSANVVVQYVYDGWGNHKVLDANGFAVTDQTHVGNVNPIRYRGYYYDTETGFYYLKSRYYDPQIGRFISPDSVDFIDPDTINGLNLYAYCGNNPVSNVDPTGNAWWNWLISGSQIVAGIVLVATGVGAGLGASLIVGSTLGMVGNIVGSQIAGGLGSMANGWGAISTGLSLFSYGWVGAITGGVMVAVGAGTMAFGANEVVAGVTGTNYIQEWTGISDSLYNGLYLGLNIASSIGTIAGRLGMRAYSTSTISGHSHLSRQGQLPYAKITRGNAIVHFDGRGNMYWSKHNALHGGKIGNPHWHSEIRGHGAERSWLGMVFELIFNELFRR